MSGGTGTFYAKPATLRVDYGHPILRGQTCWLAARDKSAAPADIQRKDLAVYANGANTAFDDCAYGRGFLFDASATTYINLGSGNTFITNNATPITVMWIERAGAAATTYGVVSIKVGGQTTASFMVLRASQTVIGTSNYGVMAWGGWLGSGSLAALLGPAKVSDSVGITRVFIVQCLAGTGDHTFSNHIAYVDGVKYTSVSGGNNGALGAAQNYFGWDNADNKAKGTFDNLRIWERILSATEIAALFNDPYLGSMRPPNPALIRFRRGLLSGNVVAGGTPIVGATVRAQRSSDGHIVDTTTTDGSGNFSLASNQIDLSALHDVMVVGPAGYDSWIHQGITPGGS